MDDPPPREGEEKSLVEATLAWYFSGILAVSALISEILKAPIPRPERGYTPPLLFPFLSLSLEKERRSRVRARRLQPRVLLFEQPRDNLLAASSADVSSYAGAKGDDFITDPGNHSPEEAHCHPSLPAFLTASAEERDALRAGAAFLAFYFAFPPRSDNGSTAARGAPRVKLLSPRIRIRQLRIRPGHGRFGDLKRRGEKRGEGSAVEPRG